MEHEDEWGTHVHISTGSPYDASKPVTCAACIRRLDSVMGEWLSTLSERHSLPEGFWAGYKYGWS